MATEELKAIKWRLVGHLHIPSARYTTYEGEYNGMTITMQVRNRTLKCGGYGKPKVAYLVGQREFKNKEELIKYISKNEKNKNRT